MLGLMLTMYLSLKLKLRVSVYVATQTLKWSEIHMLTWAATGKTYVGVVDGEAFDDTSRCLSLDDSGDETYESEPEEESEDDEGKMVGTDEEEKDERMHEGTTDAAVQGDANSAEPNGDNDWDSDTDQLCDAILMLTESSEVYTDEQLGRMKQDGWDVLPDNVEAEVVDDPTVDKIHHWEHIMKRKNSHFGFLVRLHKAFIEERETVSHKPEDGLDSMVKQSDPRLYTTTMR
ncbi:hypothetical protein JG688_00013089 [Phytophthora aleatoria]|uniref:Uncharacterized protein n=1 Tax=Phytophthora aleatoria TaxID=2496075 RepID=A0A8J5M1H9_9STRA|nr:hypothetical protein JG688_00013089 [Phytophthora aleatoria]